MPRDVIIPPVTLPGGGAGRIEINLRLIDGNGVPVPASDVGNTAVVAGLGRHVVELAAVELTLATQDDLAGTTYYEIEYRQGRERWLRTVQVPAGGAMTWAEFAELGAPVDPADIWSSRLLPTSAADGQGVTWDDDSGVWLASTLAGSGDMLASVYDPQGIGGDAFDAGNLTGLDGVDATGLLNGPAEADATADQTGAEVEGLLDAELANTDWKKPVGTTAGTVAAGDDSRLSNARTPTAHAASHALGADALSPVIAPRTTVTISSGAAAFELNNSAYTCQLSEDLTTITVPLPTGGNAATHDFLGVIDFTPPSSGGPFAVSIPTAWNQLGPLNAISLSAGDAPITVVVGTYADGSIKYTAQQGVPGA